MLVVLVSFLFGIFWGLYIKNSLIFFGLFNNIGYNFI